MDAIHLYRQRKDFSCRVYSGLLYVVFVKVNKKKLVAFRLRSDVQKTLSAIAKRSGKTKTRIMEDAILLHAKELAA